MKTYKKTAGAAILRGGVFIFCCISFINTANGLKEYVFSSTPIIAYAISLVFQSVIAVISLKFTVIREAIKKNHHKKENHLCVYWGEKIEKSNRPLINQIGKKIKEFSISRFLLLMLPCIIGVVTFAASIFFDYIFIVNSTYAVTDKDDIMNNVTAEFIIAKKPIMALITPYYNAYSSQLYDNIAEIDSVLNGADAGAHKTEWEEFWATQQNEHPIYNLGDLSLTARARSTNSTGKTEGISEAANYTVNSYMNSIINDATVLKTDSISLEYLNQVTQKMEEIDQKLSDLIEVEQYYYDKCNSIEFMTQEKATPPTLPTMEPIEDEKNISHEIIYSKLAIYEKNRYNEQNQNVPDATRPPADSDGEENHPRVNYDWEHGLTRNMVNIYMEISKQRIESCRKAKMDLNLYKTYFTSIAFDARYNLAQLLAITTSSEIINQDEVDSMISVISRGIFSADKTNTNIIPESMNKPGEFKELKNLKTTLTYYIPIKNIMTIITNNDWANKDEKPIATIKPTPVLETDDPNNNVLSWLKDKDEDKKTKELSKNESDTGFDEEKAKEDIDLLIQNLALLPENIGIGVDEEHISYMSTPTPIPSSTSTPDSNLNSENESQSNLTKVETAIGTLIRIEDSYLNKKNPMTAAIKRLSDKRTIEQFDTIVPKKNRSLAWFAFIFAIAVDCLSLIIGFILYYWTNNEHDNK